MTRVGHRKEEAMAILKEGAVDFSSWLAIYKESDDPKPKRTIEALINGGNVFEKNGKYYIKPKEPNKKNERSYKKTEKKIPMYRGYHPSPDSGYIFNGSLIVDGVGWAVYVKDAENQFLNIKVVLIDGRERKANFYFAIFTPENRFSNSSDLDKMKEHQNKLFKMVHNFFKIEVKQ